jgi:hypothetical protein
MYMAELAPFVQILATLTDLEHLINERDPALVPRS